MLGDDRASASETARRIYALALSKDEARATAEGGSVDAALVRA